jgi:hypothetical protein
VDVVPLNRKMQNSKPLLVPQCCPLHG